MTIVSGIQPAGSRRLAPAEPLREVRYEIGAPVTCQDGPCGELSRLVVDPLRGVVTHLVVEPRHHHALARLVPVAIVEIDDGTLRLRCSRAIFCALQYAEEMEFLTPLDPTDAMTYTGGAMSPLDMLVWPYWAPARTPIRHERVPLGEVEIRRGEHVRALDGPIGKIQGLVVDPPTMASPMSCSTRAISGAPGTWPSRSAPSAASMPRVCTCRCPNTPSASFRSSN